ncbi:MAG: type II toxin-antitoxin system HicB family antitoxin [Clostridia bacterium]|nr:type II toxin-antitoxin system HicB family antitoxin [Clostridia bacterium]
MQQYIFPAVLYKDDAGKGYTIVLQDINICTEGATVEEAFVSAKEYLEVYCRCALEYNGEVENASTFADVKSDYKNNIVLLVDAVLPSGKKTIKAAKFSLDV